MKKRMLGGALALFALLTVLILAGLRPPTRAQVCEGLTQGMQVRGPQSAQRLAVVLHGMRAQATELLPLADTLLTAPGYADTRVLIPSLPFSTLSTAAAEDITACLVQFVDKEWQARKAAGQPYQSVLLAGHSMGSLFTRKLYVVARGELASAPFEKSLRSALGLPAQGQALVPPREWARAVDRIVLLGAINRGWSVDHHMPVDRVFTMQAGLAFNRLVQAVGGPPFAVMATRKGAPFVTQLRLQWLAMMDCADRQQTAVDTSGARCSGGDAAAVAQVAQLLGTQDDLIPPGDGIDPVAGSRFTYLEVAKSNHRDVVDMGGDSPVARLRADAFRQALKPGVIEGSVSPELVAARGAPDFDVKHMVFVMHGIRDEGFWTERLGARVRAALQQQPGCAGDPHCKVKLEVSSYGYFPMLSFLKPGSRNEKVEWLMDLYADARARYPNAKFYYVGHSHGTYLLKEALENYEAVRFERVALAGSVLRTDQDWPALLKSGRINGVLNLSANEDWVVAFFPNALQMVNLQDLGGAGFYGFNGAGGPAFVQFPVEQDKQRKSWVLGGHGAGVGEDWWEHVAGFIATGKPPVPHEKLLSDKQAGWVWAGGAVAPFIWLVIGVLLVLGVRLLVRSRLREWAKTAALIGYGWFVWFVLTSV